MDNITLMVKAGYAGDVTAVAVLADYLEERGCTSGAIFIRKLLPKLRERDYFVILANCAPCPKQRKLAARAMRLQKRIVKENRKHWRTASHARIWGLNLKLEKELDSIRNELLN